MVLTVRQKLDADTRFIREVSDYTKGWVRFTVPTLSRADLFACIEQVVECEAFSGEWTAWGGDNTLTFFARNDNDLMVIRMLIDG